LGNRWAFLKGDGARTLRRIKKRQDEESQDTFLKTRPPEGVAVEYIYFRLFDIFQIEDVDNLINGLRKLFPNFDDDLL
jgi:hypothetical protein